jgi:hypothetical protein
MRERFKNWAGGMMEASCSHRPLIVRAPTCKA